MENKQPPRLQEDDTHIQALPVSLPSPPLDEQGVYNTLRKPSRRGIVPGPSGDRFEFLQSVTFNPYDSPEATTALHLLTRLANIEVEGLIPPEWYDYNTYSILVAHGEKMRPLGMGSTSRKLVTAASLAKHSEDILNELCGDFFFKNSLCPTGSISTRHLIEARQRPPRIASEDHRMTNAHN